jgi:L-asparaginase II
VHQVAACACDDEGNVLLSRGTIDVPVFLRSSAKPFIAAAVIRSGAAAHFHLNERELAVMCASHQGEPAHVETVAGILAKIGATEDTLACGVQAPAFAPAAKALALEGRAPTQLHHNCSGKHAGILALAAFRGIPFDGYLALEHPAEREILGFCERVFVDRFDGDRLAVDGCGIPVFATSLASAARAFARFATLRGYDDGDAQALEAARRAMVRHPWLVAGTGGFDTDLMEAAGANIAAKSGAEGVHASSIAPAGTGLVVKVVDGARRAVAPAAIALLHRIGAVDRAAEEALSGHARTPVFNVRGAVVGEVAARDF